MQDTDETKALVRKFSDRSRKSKRVGNQFVVPHKFTPKGDVLRTEDEELEDGTILPANCNPRTDLSKYSLNDFRFLAALQEKRWNFDAACKVVGVDPDTYRKRMKKFSYFEFEEKKSEALAAIANPAFVTAKNVEGFYTDKLSDGQRDHLKELAKITGAYKPTTNVNLNVNAFVKPQLSPEQEKATREFFDTIATEATAA